MVAPLVTKLKVIKLWCILYCSEEARIQAEKEDEERRLREEAEAKERMRMEKEVGLHLLLKIFAPFLFLTFFTFFFRQV